MTDEQLLIAFIITVIVVAVWLVLLNRSREKKALALRLKENYAKPFSNEHEHEHLVNLHEMIKKDENALADEIWHDLSMDAVFDELDQSVSAIGEEYLYKTLRHPVFDEELLNKRSALADELGDEDYNLYYRGQLSQISKQRKYTVFQFIDTILSASARNSIYHIFSLLAFIAALVLLFIMPNVGGIMLLIVVCLNSISYFSTKGKIAAYNYSIEVIVRWLASVRHFSVQASMKEEKPVLHERLGRIRSYSGCFDSIRRISWLFAPQNAVSSIFDILLDYIKFFTHIDIIGFNFLVKNLSSHRDELFSLYEETGELELGIIIAQLRAFPINSCIPEFVHEGRAFTACEMVHPLVMDAVPNDVSLNGNALITGSNASGKSTFLKMVSLNLLLSETLKLAFAKSLSLTPMRLMTSFDISDDIIGGDSFYIAEIKRLKKILEASRPKDDSTVLICIDEILKGTNTTERIAASSEILKYLANGSAMVLAATHDVELTGILENVYENYYFTEDPDNDRIFDYKLHKGRNYNGNAIRLLKLYGFPDEVVDGSMKAVAGGRSDEG